MSRTLRAASVAVVALNVALVSAQVDKLEWSNARCDEFATTAGSAPLFAQTLECAWFPVPLDYNDAGAGEMNLALIRSRATGPNRKGSLIVNPGGPGASGITFLSGYETRMRGEVGANYDIVSFAPRGVSPSGPDGLFTDEVLDSYLDYTIATYGPGTVASIGNLTTDEDAQFLLSQATKLDTELKKFDTALQSLTGGKLRYVGTTATARDVARITDTLDGAGAPINYWGFSYGTILGMQIVQLFSDRTGKVLIDGVVDPRFWGNRNPAVKPTEAQIADSDQVYQGFLRVCATAGPGSCPVARTGDTAQTIDARIQTALNELHSSYDSANDYTFVTVVSTFFVNLYSPLAWQSAAATLVQMVPSLGSPNSVKVRGAGGRPSSHPPPPVPFPLAPPPPIPFPLAATSPHLNKRQHRLSESETVAYRSALSLLAISCGDNAGSGITTEQVLNEMVRSSREVSRMFGASFGYSYYCNTWTATAVERYSGPWTAKPKNPVLVISTELDPITPFKAAQIVASDEMLGSSARLIQIYNFGHTSYATNSACVKSAISAYMNEDTAPTDLLSNNEDLECPTEARFMGTDGGTHWVTKDEIDAADFDIDTSTPTPTPGGNTGPGTGTDTGTGNDVNGGSDDGGDKDSPDAAVGRRTRDVNAVLLSVLAFVLYCIL